jgi:hypothetical protein
LAEADPFVPWWRGREGREGMYLGELTYQLDDGTITEVLAARTSSILSLAMPPLHPHPPHSEQCKRWKREGGWGVEESEG